MKTSYVICFVCGSKGANCILYVKPRTKGSYFSFLENHDPPKGAKLPNGDGVVNACLVCYAFLNQQWDSFEKTKTPLVKRLYWLKRIDNRSFTGAELNVQGEYVAQIMGVQYNCGLSGNASPFEYGSHTGISCNVRNAAPSPLNDSNVSPPRDEKPIDVLEVLDLSVSPKKPEVAGHKSQKLVETNGEIKPGNSVTSAGNKSKSGSIICYVCSKLCPVSLARFVYAIDQSNDDEPYFPFLLELSEPPGAMPLTRNGVTQVCSECRKSLNRQWRFFDTQKVPVADRVYKIKDLPIALGKLTKENKGTESTCYLCDELHLLNSMHALKMLESDSNDRSPSLLQFVKELKHGCLGSQALDCGVVLVCVPCHDRVLSQWKLLDRNDLSLDKKFSLLRPGINGTNSKFSVTSPSGTSLSNDCKPTVQKKGSVRNSIAVHEESKPDNSGDRTFQSAILEPLYVSSKLAPSVCSDGMFKLPFDSPVLQVKTDCNKNTVVKTNSTAPNSDEGTLCNGRTVASPKQSHLGHIGKKLPPDSVCFLCGFKCTPFVIRDRPSISVSNNGNDRADGVETPFFPYLNKLSPTLGADAMTADGCVSACFLCYLNLVSQWKFYEKSNVEDQNRWTRNYKYRTFFCSICKENCERQNVEIISSKEFKNLDGLDITWVDAKSDDNILVCSNCCAAEKFRHRLDRKPQPISTNLSILRSTGKCSQNDSESPSANKMDDDSGPLPAVAERDSASDRCFASSASVSCSLSLPVLSSSLSSSYSQKQKDDADAEIEEEDEETSGNERKDQPQQQHLRPVEHLLAGGGSSCLDALRRMAMYSFRPMAVSSSNLSDEVKKFAGSEKLRNGETGGGGGEGGGGQGEGGGGGCDASIDAQKTFQPQHDEPRTGSNHRNGFVSVQEHLSSTVDRPSSTKYPPGKLEGFGTLPSRSIPLSSVPPSASVPSSEFPERNGYPFVMTSNDLLMSSVNRPSLNPDPFSLIPESSVANFPALNSSFSWEDYQSMQKYQLMLSSYLQYQRVFQPSLIPPMLSFNSSFLNPFFYPNNMPPSVGLVGSSSPFDLTASPVKVDDGRCRDVDGTDSANSQMDVCAEGMELPRVSANNGSGIPKVRKHRDRNVTAQLSDRSFSGRMETQKEESLDGHTDLDQREKSLNLQPKKNVSEKHNFHRPFLENSTTVQKKNDGAAKRKRKRSERNDEELLATVQTLSSSPRGCRSVDSTNCAPVSGPCEEVGSFPPSTRSSEICNTTKQPNGSHLDHGFSSNFDRNGDYQCKDERLNAAIGLISLYSAAHVQNSPERNDRDPHRDSTPGRSEPTGLGSTSGKSLQPNSVVSDSNAFETATGKRRCLDGNRFDNPSNGRIHCDDDDSVFTESVLPTQNSPSDVLSRAVSSVSDDDSKAAMFPWPGVDAVIESYQQYCQDYAMEKSFLWDQNRQTNESRHQLITAAELLSNRISELTRTKQDLEIERLKLQSHLDVFVSYMNQLR